MVVMTAPTVAVPDDLVTMKVAANLSGVKYNRIYEYTKRGTLTTYGTGLGDPPATHKGALVSLAAVKTMVQPSAVEDAPPRPLLVAGHINESFLPRDVTADMLVKALGREHAREVLEKVFAATSKPISDKALHSMIELCEAEGSSVAALPAIRRYLATNPYTARKMAAWARQALDNQGFTG